jgi:hypothetical protein
VFQLGLSSTVGLPARPNYHILTAAEGQNHITAAIKLVYSTMASKANDWHTACNWLSHRHRGYLSILESADYVAAKWLMKGLMPHAPDYTSLLLSKRSWERAMQEWRHKLKTLRHLADERINNLNCYTMVWLGGPEWLLLPPSPVDISWPTRLAGEHMPCPDDQPIPAP